MSQNIPNISKSIVENFFLLNIAKTATASCLYISGYAAKDNSFSFFTQSGCLVKGSCSKSLVTNGFFLLTVGPNCSESWRDILENPPSIRVYFSALKFVRNIIKLVFSVGIAELAYVVTRWSIHFYLLTISYEPHLTSIIAHVSSAIMFATMVNLGVKTTKLFNNRSDHRASKSNTKDITVS